MSKIIKDMNSFYNRLYELDMWSDSAAEHLLAYRNDKERRILYLKRLFTYILDTSAMNDFTKEYIRSGLSESDAARVHGINTSTAKSLIHYANNKMGEAAIWSDSMSIVSFVIFKADISEDEWQKLEQRYKMIVRRTSKRLIQKKDILINISTQEYAEEIDDKSFGDFLYTIAPYTVSNRKKNQNKVNNMTNAIGYFNYIMSDGMQLSEEDEKRRDKVMELLGLQLCKPRGGINQK